ncbi:MAG TPA: sigma-70 family RNA polymerase sigma factor [Polyangiaceae bacterium]|jgi:RNA polymerase sigma-70 factor (ECF subfamily)
MTRTECNAADMPSLARERASMPVDRVRGVVEAQYDFVWRTLRTLGLGGADAEDAAQQVMCVLARRIDDVEAGAERAFLFSTATHVASTWRRTARRHPEDASDDLDTRSAPAPSVEDLLDRRRAYEVLERVLQAMPVELRIVFVLYELEEMTTPAIAEVIGVPVGTIASRLRRARESFQAIVKRMQAVQRGRKEQP